MTFVIEALYRIARRGQRLQVLRDIDLHIDVGGVYGLLGPNGAGITTLLARLKGLLRATSKPATAMTPECQLDIQLQRTALIDLPTFGVGLRDV
jgi:ABC-type hemin transport system ATPase subunit